jgi:uncharacterized membrane protein
LKCKFNLFPWLTEETLNRWHDDPGNWRWGLIYFNPRDRRIFVLKRNRWMGITLNFARPESHLIMALILGLIILLAGRPR